MRGGMMYGPVGGLAPGAMQWGAVNTSQPVNPTTGQPMVDPYSSGGTSAMVGGRRRPRKSKKGSKRRITKKGGRRHKRRTMRGGTWSPNAVNQSGTGAAFVGGIPNFPHGGGTYGSYASYATRVPAGDPHTMGADGVMKF